MVTKKQRSVRSAASGRFLSVKSAEGKRTQPSRTAVEQTSRTLAVRAGERGGSSRKRSSRS